MKKLIIVVLIGGLIPLFSCTKEKKSSSKQDAVSNYKSGRGGENLDSLVGTNRNYIGLIREISTFTNKLISSDLTFAQYKDFLLHEDIDSINSRIELTSSEIAHYDTIFEFYAGQLSDDFRFDTISVIPCASCGYTIEEKIDLSEGYWDYFRTDTSRIASYYGSLLDTQQGGCASPWGYAICCAACVLTFGEIPPLCVICIWQCACQFCPSPNIGCSFMTE